MNLTEIYTTFHPKIAEYTFFLSAHETFSRIHDMLDHKTSGLNKLKKTETISSIFSDHNSVKLGNNYRKKKKKTH